MTSPPPPVWLLPEWSGYVLCVAFGGSSDNQLWPASRDIVHPWHFAPCTTNKSSARRTKQTNALGPVSNRPSSYLLFLFFSFPPNDDVVVTDMRLLEATFLAGRRLLLPVRLQYRRGNIYFIIQRVLRTLLWLTWFRSSIHVAWRRWSRPAPSSTPTWYSCASRHTDSLVTIGKWRQSRKK